MMFSALFSRRRVPDGASKKTPLRVGIIGLGGYAYTHHQAILRLERENEARLICTCDPSAAVFTDKKSALNFARRGVKFFDNYRAMLEACAGELDLVVIPTPLALHAEMHRACVEAGIACYLEKPPTLDGSELELMIETERNARKKTLVGFNYIIEPARLAIKQRMIAGEFGAIQRATFLGCWSRPSTYFQRNNWSGRLLIGDRLVLDSCFGNALSHFVHNLLFWVGDNSQISGGTITEVRARLYRAHAIEGADTFFVEAMVSNVLLRVVASHACREKELNTETVVCEKATIRYVAGHKGEIVWNDGRREPIGVGTFETPLMNHRDYYRYLRGETDRPAITLEDCRSFVHLNGLTYISSETIENIAPEHLILKRGKGAAAIPIIANLKTHGDQFLNHGVWPDLGARKWPNGPGAVKPSDLPRLREVLLEMARLPEDRVLAK
jgi:predicted dehydrogenase